MTSSAAATGARRPTAVAATSSCRPDSSSARVWRTTVSNPASPTSTSRKPDRQAASAPALSPSTGPIRASSAGLAAMLLAYAARSAAVS